MNRRTSLVGEGPFFDPTDFPWSRTLESAWEAIRDEASAMLERREQIPAFQQVSPDQRILTEDDGWKTFMFYWVGFRVEPNCRRCPNTARLLQEIPGMSTAFFSILAPHKRVPEHVGVYNGVFRYHLGLIVPEGVDRCGIRVAGETRTWEEGKSLIFNDNLPHEAWNETDRERVVLFVDFFRPQRRPFAILNRLQYRIGMHSPFAQAGVRNLEEWERAHEDPDAGRSAAPRIGQR